MRYSRLIGRFVATILLSSGLSACSMSTSVLSLQDKFTYPNGDYKPEGHAAAERTYARLFSGKVMTREVFRDLEQQALASKSGADIMVDYVVSSNVIAFPYLYLPLASVTTFRLEGTAVRTHEVGEQKLSSQQVGVQ